MIFAEATSGQMSYENINESPYDLGIGGALMHVYENECNYNAIMKAAAISEMRYYNETGGDLFVQEAGALSGFFEKVKAFFKKVIEKIKSIFKKFVAKINQFTMKDKDFVKKYRDQIARKNLTDFEFDGYKFAGNLAGKLNLTVPANTLIAGVDHTKDSDAINDVCETNRGKIIDGKVALTESEFRDELREVLYGDKESFKPSIRDEFDFIDNTQKAIKENEKTQKDTIKIIEDIIKDIDKNIKTLSSKKAGDTKLSTPNKYGVSSGELSSKYTDNESADNATKAATNRVTVYKSFSNDLTVAFGAVSKAIVDRNRQAKAICVKALSYKHESATVYGGGADDIFANVQIV